MKLNSKTEINGKYSLSLFPADNFWLRGCRFFMTAHLFFLLTYVSTYGQSNPKIDGELKKWHKVTLTFDGPQSSESSEPNPFLDYRMDVTFTNGAKRYVVPGYFAADGTAGETSATSGNKWRVHFSPDATGTWNYEVSFRKGNNVAVSDYITSGVSAGFFDQFRGTINIQNTDKTGRDHRAKGRLSYVGKHYLQYQETKEYFVKGGADSPENFLAYSDFDGSFKNDGIKDNLIKTWQPHVQDWNTGDPVWKNGKGKGIIGSLNYLASKGMNAFSFLTMNIEGDDSNVYPYTGYNERLRFDVSKLDQWEVVFDHADQLGLFMHFKTQETENDQLLDGGKLGVQRKLYYRMLIARFAHHLALNWNLGEENDVFKELNDPDHNLVKSYAEYFYDNDPYSHHIVIHTYPWDHNAVYPKLTGSQSKLTGASLQLHPKDVPAFTKKWVNLSASQGKPWVVANDEQGDHRTGVLPNGYSSNHKLVRNMSLWGNLMANGSGVEYYFGYEYPQSDLTCEDWRSRSEMWDYTRYALDFFRKRVRFWEMKNFDNLLTSNNGYCLGENGNAYVVYLTSGGRAQLDLSNDSNFYKAAWYNPRTGKYVATSSILAGGKTVSSGLPPSNTQQDWVWMLTVDTEPDNAPTAPTAPSEDCRADFVEENGIAVIEAESAPSIAQGWTKRSNIGGYTGDSYLEWTGSNHFKTPGNGTLTYKIYIGTTGTYRFQWRNRIAVGTNNTEHNDGWLRFPDATDFYGKSGSSIVYPHGTGKNPNPKGAGSDGWLKLYTNQINTWSWDANTSDHDAHQVYVEFSSPGVYTMEISGRSFGHAIDRVVLSHSSINATDAQSTGLAETICVGSTPTPEEPEITTNVIPGKVQAEAYASMSGIKTQPTTDAGGGENIGWIQNGDYADFQVDVTSAGTYEVSFRVASNTTGGIIELQNNGTTIGQVSVPNTGGWQSWQTVSTQVDLRDGLQTLRTHFKGDSGYLLNLNYLEFYDNTLSNSPISNSETIIINPIHDAYLQNGSRYNNSELRVESGIRQSYLMFDLSTVPGTVAGATLQLTVGSDPGEGDIEVAVGDHNNWSETTITANNKPVSVLKSGIMSGKFSQGVTYSFDLSGIESGKMVTLIVTHSTGNDVAFASSENAVLSARPKLIITSSEGTISRTADSVKGIAAKGQTSMLDEQEMLIDLEVSIYPNPVIEYANIQMSQAGGFSLLDQSGFALQNGELSSGVNTLNLSHLKKGIYILKIVSGNSTEIRKIIKK